MSEQEQASFVEMWTRSSGLTYEETDEIAFRWLQEESVRSPHLTAICAYLLKRVVALEERHIGRPDH